MRLINIHCLHGEQAHEGGAQHAWMKKILRKMSSPLMDVAIYSYLQKKLIVWGLTIKNEKLQNYNMVASIHVHDLRASLACCMNYYIYPYSYLSARDDIIMN